MKAKYITITIALVLSAIFGGIYMKFFSTINETITIYVCQVGIYEDETNANDMKQNLTNLELPTYSYQKDQTFVVISDIFLEEDKAKEYGTTVSEKQITCAIREYSIPKEMKSLVENKEYDEVLKEIAKQ
ncbi:MAG: SPOR domain-containing protein [Coprobacillaceae bacterium]